MKYVSQLLYTHWRYVTKTDVESEAGRQSGMQTTVSSSGCGLCSAVMVADRLLPNCAFDVQDALELSYEVKANHSSGTDYVRFAPAFAEKMGLKMERTLDTEQMKHCLRTGGAVVVHVLGDKSGHPGIFSNVGHYMVIVNEEPDGRIAILDPSYKPGKFDAEHRRGKVEVKNDVILLTDPAHIASELRAYYLFWRA